MLLDRRDLERYTKSLERELDQTSDAEDLQVLRALLEDFLAASASDD